MDSTGTRMGQMAPAPRKWRVWIVSEGSPGHVSQSMGLVRELAKGCDIEVERIETRHRFGGLVRRLVRAWMVRSGRRLPDGFLRKRLGCVVAGNSRPDMIIASGGKSVFAARSLALAHGAPFVFIGERKPYPSAWFDVVLTPSPYERGVKDVAIEIIPTGMSPEVVAAAAAAWEGRPDGRLWAMLVGGGSASHRYTEEDWQALGTWMNSVARSHSVRWLLTTSRRTGAGAEACLKAVLESSALAAEIWWSENPERGMAKFLGSSELAFVTQDSVTMVSEAVLSGKPVVVVFPAEVRFSEGDFLEAYYANLENKGWIKRCLISRLPDGESLVPPAGAGCVSPFSPELLDKLHDLMKGG